MVWMVWGLAHGGNYWWGIEPMYPGLMLSFVIGMAGIRRVRP